MAFGGIFATMTLTSYQLDIFLFSFSIYKYKVYIVNCNDVWPQKKHGLQ